MARLLIAEDDPVIATAMATHLRHAGFDVEVADRGDRAMRKLRFERPDAAIIDLMLPGMDGWQITKDVRAEGMQIPVLIVSARASEPDKVHALGLGADDYLAKPFGMPELVARVQALLRRSHRDDMNGGRRERIEVPGLVIDPDLHRVLVDGRDAGLTALEFRLLYVLADERGRALTRDQLQQRVWGVPHRPRDRSVDVCVRKLREKLERSPTGYRYIHTHYGVGYRFDAVPTP
ncbi:MAG TPA: response regulator transcription factor [Gaiellales bacterium]|nr:response regulator transcription factor [Gaiellales bacterium]